MLADGAATRLVILTHSKSTPWKQFNKRARLWLTALDDDSSDTARLLVAQSAAAAMRLLLACHVHVTAGGQWKAANPAVAEVPAHVLRLAAVRCSQMDAVGEMVAGVFAQQLAAATVAASAASGASDPLSALLLDGSMVAFCATANDNIRALLWPDGEVVVCCDDAHSLIGNLEVFAGARRSAAAASEAADFFDGLTSACMDVLDAYRWLPVISGLWLQLVARVAEPHDISCTIAARWYSLSATSRWPAC